MCHWTGCTLPSDAFDRLRLTAARAGTDLCPGLKARESFVELALTIPARSTRLCVIIYLNPPKCGAARLKLKLLLPGACRPSGKELDAARSPGSFQLLVEGLTEEPEEEVDDEDEELETPEAALQRHLAEDSCSRSVAPLCKRKKII